MQSMKSRRSPARILAAIALMSLLALPIFAQDAPTFAAVGEIKATGEKLANVEVMLDNQYGTLKSTLYSPARGWAPVDAQDPSQYLVYQFDGKKYAVGWIPFVSTDGKYSVTSFLFFKEKDPGKVSFVGGIGGQDGKLSQVMFAKLVPSLPDPVLVLVGSEYVYVATMDSSSGIMNFDPGSDNTLKKIELFTNRLILTIQDAYGDPPSEKFFDWSDASKRIQMNFSGKR
jgi:hypothetical protein